MDKIETITKTTLYNLLLDTPVRVLERAVSGCWQSEKKYNRNEFFDFYAELLKTQPEHSDYVFLFKEERRSVPDGTLIDIDTASLVRISDAEKICNRYKMFSRIVEAICKDIQDLPEDYIIDTTPKARKSAKPKKSPKKHNHVPQAVVLGSAIITDAQTDWTKATLIAPVLIELIYSKTLTQTEEKPPVQITENQAYKIQTSNYLKEYHAYNKLFESMFTQQYEEDKDRYKDIFEYHTWRKQNFWRELKEICEEGKL